jgi:hypothetical protein
VSFLSFLFDPIGTVRSGASTIADAGMTYACSTKIDEARLAEANRQQRCDWWSKNGVLVGAGVVLGVLVLREVTRKD